MTIKYTGQNENGIFTRWLDHLLLYFQLNRMCGPDDELVRLSAMYNSLEGWQRNGIVTSCSIPRGRAGHSKRWYAAFS